MPAGRRRSQANGAFIARMIFTDKQEARYVKTTPGDGMAVAWAEARSAHDGVLKGWCGREDSNFHGLSPTATSTLRVYHFRHDRIAVGGK